MPQHIKRLVAILVVVLLVAVGGARYFTDPSYYRFGNYRADAVPMLAAGSPQFQGSAACLDCHAPPSTAWQEGKHIVVQCEVCHGAAAGHPQLAKLAIPPDVIELCSLCHEAMPARPATQPQIVIGEHPYRQEQPVPCTTCHNAHKPDLRRSAAQSAAIESVPLQSSPRVPQCASCHGAAGLGVAGLPGLAGKSSAYLAAQLRQFRSGELDGTVMNDIAANMDDEQIVQLADYYAGLPPLGAGQK